MYSNGPDWQERLRRLVWIERLKQVDPILAEMLTTFGQLFQARVHRLHHSNPHLCWMDTGDWQSDHGIVPQPTMNLRRKKLDALP